MTFLKIRIALYNTFLNSIIDIDPFLNSKFLNGFDSVESTFWMWFAAMTNGKYRVEIYPAGRKKSIRYRRNAFFCILDARTRRYLN